jgi:DNA-binding LacI/PurR family transcriptional regulator/signal transduction histidine kinase/ActR/RegA family two-component response regulator
MVSEKRNPRLGFLTIDHSNSFGGALLRGAVARSREIGLDLLVVDGGTLANPYEWEAQRNRLYSMVARETFDGLLLANIFSQVPSAEGERFLERFAGIPVVTLVEKFAGVPAVRIDNGAGLRQLISHLADRCGSRRFAAIAGPVDNYDSTERLAILRSQLERRGLPLPPEAIYLGDFSEPSGREGVRVLLEERRVPFDTLVCFNDLMAVAALEELSQRGRSVPADVKVTGFDNTYDAVYSSPPLTTVHNPASAMAAAGVDLVHALLRGEQVPDLTLLPTVFVPRRSCGEASISGLEGPGRRGGRGRKAGARAKAGATSGPKLVARATAQALKATSDPIPDRERRWFRTAFRELAGRVLADGRGAPRQFLEDEVFAHDAHTWSAETWIIALEALQRESAALGLGGPRVRAHLAELADVSRAVRDARFAEDHLQLQRTEKRLFQLGEGLMSGFELAAIGPALARLAARIGLETCFVAAFTDPGQTRARLLVALEDGRLTTPTPAGEFPAAQLLPDGLLSRHRSLMLNALHVREEPLGYFLVNVSRHPGALGESLRHQLSTAIKGAQLMSTVRSYSEGLERMVEERTRTLAQVNQDLRGEIVRRELAERELLKRKHLDAIGLLAGGIAHDFNNILTAITAGLSLLQEDEGTPDDRAESYDLMMKAVANARNLTHQLLTFAKGGTPIKKAMELVPLIQEVAMFLLRGSTVLPRFDFPSERIVVEMDHHQISQVVTNLVLNALQAMPGGGTLTFRVRPRPSGPPAAGGDGAEDFVLVSIRDTGAGIPPEIVDRIFDPYFTTKQTGSGLGLPTSLAIIRRHGGDIRVTSELGAGTEFEIRLPLSRKQVAVAAAPDLRRIPPGLSILVLEDDPTVAAVFARLLQDLGAEHRITADGEDAIRLQRQARESGAPFDLVIADLTIPGGLGGAEVIRRLRDAGDAVRAIVTSGYSDLPALAEPERFGFRAILRKPFTVDDLRGALLAALEADAPLARAR